MTPNVRRTCGLLQFGARPVKKRVNRQRCRLPHAETRRPKSCRADEAALRNGDEGLLVAYRGWLLGACESRAQLDSRTTPRTLRI